jgi:hypothetical protein
MCGFDALKIIRGRVGGGERKRWASIGEAKKIS